RPPPPRTLPPYTTLFRSHRTTRRSSRATSTVGQDSTRSGSPATASSASIWSPRRTTRRTGHEGVHQGELRRPECRRRRVLARGGSRLDRRPDQDARGCQERRGHLRRSVQRELARSEVGEHLTHVRVGGGLQRWLLTRHRPCTRPRTCGRRRTTTQPSASATGTRSGPSTSSSPPVSTRAGSGRGYVPRR